MAAESDSKLTWITRLTRVGWLSKGFVFIVIGIIAFRIAFGSWGGSGSEATQTGALRAISAQPFGAVLLTLVSAGLVVFGVWNVIQAVISDSTDLDFLGLAKRIGWFGLGVFYGAVAFAGFRMVLTDVRSSGSDGAAQSGGGGGGGGGGQTDPSTLTARLLDAQGGRVVALIIAAVVLVVAGYHFHKGVTYGFVDDVDTDDLDQDQEDRLGRLGVGGFVARAIVLVVVAYFLGKAAIEYDPSEAVGLDGALREFATVTYGRILIALVGLGLVLAGTYDMVTFRRQRLR